MFSRHCSDEQLLAHADGELPWWPNALAKRHLERCWHCRARLEDLEQRAHAAARLLLDGGGTWDIRTTAAKAKFRAQAREEERLAAGMPRSALIVPGDWRRPAFAALCLVAVAGAITLARREARLPEPAGIVSRWQKSNSHPEASHQVFRTEIRQVRPVTVLRTGTLEVWTDNSAGRFASRWTAPDGMLVHARWRPSSAEEYVLDPAAAEQPLKRKPVETRVVSLAELSRAGLSSARIETAFLEWLDSRDWQALSADSALFMLASRDGATLRIDRCGAGKLCLTARRSFDGLTAEVTVNMDEADYRPRIQTLVLEDAGRRIEFRLASERTEHLTTAELTPALFVPDARFARKSRQGAPHLFSSETNTQSLPPSPPAWIKAREIELHFALHRLGACLGESVEVRKGQRGELTVSGIVEKPERKTQIIAALAELGDPVWVKVNIRTAAEQASLRSAATSRSATVSGVASPLNSVESFPAHSDLARYFSRIETRKPGSAESIERRVAQFSSRAVLLSEQAMREAWALRRLSAQFSNARDVPPQTRWLLQQMVRDHLAGIRSQAASFRDLVNPVWTPRDNGVILTEDQKTETADWAELGLRIFSEVERFHASVYSVFVGTAMAAPQNGQPPVPAGDRESLDRFLATLPAFDAQLRRAEEKIADGFGVMGSNATLPR